MKKMLVSIGLFAVATVGVPQDRARGDEFQNNWASCQGIAPSLDYDLGAYYDSFFVPDTGHPNIICPVTLAFPDGQTIKAATVRVFITSSARTGTVDCQLDIWNSQNPDWTAGFLGRSSLDLRTPPFPAPPGPTSYGFGLLQFSIDPSVAKNLNVNNINSGAIRCHVPTPPDSTFTKIVAYTFSFTKQGI